MVSDFTNLICCFFIIKTIKYVRGINYYQPLSQFVFSGFSPNLLKYYRTNIYCCNMRQSLSLKIDVMKAQVFFLSLFALMITLV